MKKEQTIYDYKKDYVYTLSDYKSQDGEFGHDSINFIHLGMGYEGEGRYGWYRDFSIEFQKDLRPTNGNHQTLTNNGLPYGGRVEWLKLEDVDNIYKIVKDIRRKSKLLDLNSPDKLSNTIAALRAAGYRKGIIDKDKGMTIGVE